MAMVEGMENMTYRKTFKGVLTLYLYHHNLKTHLEKIIVQQFHEKLKVRTKPRSQCRTDQHFKERQSYNFLEMTVSSHWNISPTALIDQS